MLYLTDRKIDGSSHSKLHWVPDAAVVALFMTFLSATDCEPILWVPSVLFFLETISKYHFRILPN